MKRGTASRVILGKNTIAEMPGGVFVGTDVILGKKDGLTNDFNGLVLSNTVMLGKKVSHAAIISVIVRGADRIVLPDAIANSLSYVKAFGGTEQNGTPTPDAPVDIVSNNGVLKYGVLSTNLLDLANCTDGYYYTPAGEYTAAPNARLSNYIPVKAGVTYTVGLIGTEGQSNVRINLFDTAKNWLSQTVFVSYAGEERTQSITPAQDGFLAFSANFQSSSRIDWNTAQVVQGSYTVETMPEYEPYREGVYTDGTVETIGIKDSKNLLPVNAEPDVLYPVTVTASGNWTASANVNNGQNLAACEIRYYNANKQQINYYTMTLYSDGRMYKTFSITTSVKYVSISRKAAYATTPVTELKVETGGTMTPYYNGGTATAEMLLKVGDYQDVQSILDGVVTRNVGVKVLDGTEPWVSAGTGAAVDYLVALTKNQFASDIDTSATYNSFLCSHLKMGNNDAENTLSITAATFGVRLGLNTDITGTEGGAIKLANAKQWLAAQYAAGTPVIVIYPLATPTTESVAGQTLQVTDGDNTLEITQASLTGLELEAQYNTLVQLTVQEVESANLDNDVTVTIL